MRKGKTKKTNFTRLAKRTLAGALSLSMVFSLNMLTMADNSGESSAGATTPATIDFSASGVVLDKTGNAATIDGKTIKFGAVNKDKPCGVEIKNPFVGNTELTSETVADALTNSKIPLNAYVYKKGTADEWTYVVAPYSTVEEASAAAAKYADPDVTGVSIVTKDEDLEPYPNWFSETADIKIASMSELTSGEAAELSFPRPEWKNGVTISTWVKASTKYATPIFVFQDRNEEKYWNSAKNATTNEEYKNEDFGGLALYTDGTFIYNQDDGVYKNDKWQNKAYGYYQNNKTTMQFESADMPTKNIGEWVYVTVSIKNSGVDVYYNGVKASVKKDDPKKYFNSGFNSNGKALTSILKDNAYMQRLTETWICKKTDNDTWNSLNSILPAATSFKNWMQNYDSDGVKYCDDMITYITNPTTKLYLGGDDGHSSDWLVQNKMDETVNGGWIGFDYTDAGKDMELKELSLVANPTSAADATKQYMEIAGIEVPKSDAEYTFAYNEDDDEFDGVNNLNSSVNNSEGSKDEYDNPTIKLGEVADGEIGQGVRVINPFRNNTELHEDFIKALEKTGKHFNGYTYSATTVNADGEKYNFVSESSTLKEAQEFYKKNGERKAAEFKRKRLMTYAANTTITGGAIVLTGDGVDVSFTAVKVEPATGMSLLEIMNVNAHVYYQSKEDGVKGPKWDANNGIMENQSVNIQWRADQLANAMNGKPQSSMNFVKQIATLNHYPSDEVILSWMKNDQLTFTSIDDPKIGEKFGEPGKEQTEAEYVGYLAPDENAGEYTFPYPTWEKGVSVSTWVKAPAVSGDAVYPTVFEFSNNTASLYLKSDGTLKFMESTDPTSEAGKNVFKAKFTGNTPNDNAGQWVFVTITVTNDNIDVFYNGVKATMTADGAYKLDGTSTQNFNYGTGFGNTNIKDRVASCVKAGRYRDLLQNYAQSTTYDDYTKYSFKNTTLQLVDFLTGDKTHLYLGGNNVAPESAYHDTANAGMEFGKTSFYNSALTVNDAAYLYVIAKGEREVEKEEPTPTGPAVTTTPPAVTTTPPAVTTTPPAITTTPPAVTTTPPAVTTTPPAVNVAGDANLDGEVDLKDATLVLKAALNIEKLEGQAKINADINENGEIDLPDATSVLKLALNIIDK